MSTYSTLQLTKIRQCFERPAVPDVPHALGVELDRMKMLIHPDAHIAIAAGSRGIAAIDQIVKVVAEWIKGQGAAPFIIPAMGSHGGATAAGQAAVLASYGITESSMGVPVRSTMETVELTRDGDPNRSFMDRYAYESDGVIVINRVKPHTDFHGCYESGLVKMCVIGLGKHRQALEIHSYGVHGLRELIPPTAARILATGKVLLGVALVENAYDETMLVRALGAEEIMHDEPRLLEIARTHMPRLPVDDIDVLIVDRMGKDISGAGIDPNIIGRTMIRGEAEPERPRISAITVADLTEGAHGNAVGMGLADVITRRLFDKIDLDATYQNAVTSTFLERGKIPVIAPTDALAYVYGRRSCGAISPGRERIVRVRDTLHLGEVYVSDAVLRDLAGRPDIEVLGQAAPVFDARGSLQPF